MLHRVALHTGTNRNHKSSLFSLHRVILYWKSCGTTGHTNNCNNNMLNMSVGIVINICELLIVETLVYSPIMRANIFIC